MKDLRFAIPAAFLAAFPVLFLYRHNFSEVADLETISIPLALSLAVAVLVFVGLSRWIPEPVRRAVYSSAIVIFLFYFGTFADLTQAARWAAPTWMSALAWTTLWFSVLMLLSRRRTSLAAL